ncbi:MAG: hypothetical protein IJT03_00595 [Clostridia bacterium]|nr:hypothetical protein [Clostridia bacterium]
MSKGEKNSKGKKPKKGSSSSSGAVEAWNASPGEEAADVLGSYTGVPYIGDLPEQDPDDL